MAESLSSAELLRQLKSLGMERLVHVVNAFLRQSYTYPPLLTFGGKTSFVYLADAQGAEAKCPVAVLPPTQQPRGHVEGPRPVAEPGEPGAGQGLGAALLGPSGVGCD